MKTEATNKSSQKTGEYLAGMKKRAFAGLLAVTGTCILLTGCGKKEEEEVPEAEIVVAEDTAPDEETVVEEDEETQAEEKEEDLHEGEAKSYLTGEWIAEDLARQRPISCMIGNTDTALPQYGVRSPCRRGPYTPYGNFPGLSESGEARLGTQQQTVLRILFNGI